MTEPGQGGPGSPGPAAGQGGLAAGQGGPAAITAVVITGSSGLIGSALAADLARSGCRVVRLVRRPARADGEVQWDPLAAGGLDPAALRGTDAVVHLAGAPLAGGRWTEARKAKLRTSRIQSTSTLVSAMVAARAEPRPAGRAREPGGTGQASGTDGPGVLLCGSAIGWYGDTGQRAVDESAPAGPGFLAALVADWEAATRPASAAGIRVVNLRSGIVLSGSGGMLGPLLPLFRLGLGARLGAGDQYLSWISRTDEAAAIRFLAERPDLAGPVNLTAPGPVTNAQFTAALAGAVGRPARLRVPASLLRAGLGEVSTELLSGARVLPRRLTEAGFEFRHPDIASALAAELAPGRPAA